jgi:PIN domain nuclease of toxin-antitoxin system
MVAIQSRRITLPHQDPADRFLAATAQVYDLTLVTADERLLHSNDFATMANM